jgi:hypothetical protein
VTVETAGSERMRIDSSGNVIIGETSTINGGNLNVATSAADATISALCRSTTDSHGVTLVFQKSSTNSGNFAATADGENLGKILFRGVNTSTVSKVGAQISVVQNGTDSSTVPADMVFTTKEAERFRFGAAGQLGIGGATYGTSGQVLTSGGSGAAPTWADAGGGAYELVSKTTISSSTSEVTVNGISAPQNQLLILIDGLELDAQGNFMLMYRNSSNANLDNTGGINANYPQASTGQQASSSTPQGNVTTASYGIFLNNGQIGANTKVNGVVRIFNFGIANAKPYATGQISHRNGTNLNEFRHHVFGAEGVFSSGQTVTGLRFYSINSQNMTSGKIYVYKLL